LVFSIFSNTNNLLAKEIGNNIKVGQTICILEAMKLMNEIESEFNAEIVEILVENGTPVEFGQVLMRVKQS